jgi:hypothetical protein
MLTSPLGFVPQPTSTIPKETWFSTVTFEPSNPRPERRSLINKLLFANLLVMDKNVGAAWKADDAEIILLMV